MNDFREIDSELDLLKSEINQYEAVNENRGDGLQMEQQAQVETHNISIPAIDNPPPREPDERNLPAIIPSQIRVVNESASDLMSLSSSGFRSTIANRILNSPAKICRKLMNREILSGLETSECFNFQDKGVPVGHGRSISRRPRSADVWLDHQPRNISKLGF